MTSNSRRAALLTVAALLSLAGAAQADPRIVTRDYDPEAVVRLEGCFGYQILIRFGAGEAIENVGVGDAGQWLVTPNQRGDLLFVKPAYRTTHGNMTVSTNRRIYAFELVAAETAACARGEVIYTLNFRYPEDEAIALEAATVSDVDIASDASETPEARNTAYTFSGSAENVPSRVFDDGEATFFRWNEGTTTPAVYAVGSDGVESAVAFSSQGDWLVAPMVAPTFVLRRGNAVATLFNDAYQTPALDAASPQPRVETRRSERGHWLARVFSRSE